MDLDKYFRNPFDNPKISIAELLGFAVDHQGRMVALSDGTTDYDDLIALTDVAFAALGGTVSDEDLKEGIKMARTAALKAKRAAVHAELNRLESLTNAFYPRGTATYIEIFPEGLVAFHKATLEELGLKLDTLIAAINPYASDIGNLDPIVLLTAEWKALRGEHLERKGDVAEAAELRREASAALRLQLFDNLLFIARRNKGQPEECRNYFSQHLLEDPQSPEEPEPEP